MRADGASVCMKMTFATIATDRRKNCRITCSNDSEEIWCEDIPNAIGCYCNCDSKGKAHCDHIIGSGGVTTSN